MDSINAPVALARVEAAGAARKLYSGLYGALWACLYWWQDLGPEDREDYRKMALAGVLLVGTVAVRLLDLAGRSQRERIE